MNVWEENSDLSYSFFSTFHMLAAASCLVVAESEVGSSKTIDGSDFRLPVFSPFPPSALLPCRLPVLCGSRLWQASEKPPSLLVASGRNMFNPFVRPDRISSSIRVDTCIDIFTALMTVAPNPLISLRMMWQPAAPRVSRYVPNSSQDPLAGRIGYDMLTKFLINRG